MKPSKDKLSLSGAVRPDRVTDVPELNIQEPDFPPFLDRKSPECYVNKPATPEQQARIDAAMANAHTSTHAAKETYAAKELALAKEHDVSFIKNPLPSPRKAARPANAFTLNEWAIDNKIEPRHARIAARKIKADITKLQVPGVKYTFLPDARTALDTLIRAAMIKHAKRSAKRSSIGGALVTPAPPPNDNTNIFEAKRPWTKSSKLTSSKRSPSSSNTTTKTVTSSIKPSASSSRRSASAGAAKPTSKISKASTSTKTAPGKTKKSAPTHLPKRK